MFSRFGEFISRYWWLVITSWVLLLVFTKLQAPQWDDVTYDGDLAYMPEEMPSVVGERLLESAFPQGRTKSEMTVIISRDDQPLGVQDVVIIDRLAARLKNLFGVAAYLRADELWAIAAEERQVNNGKEADRLFNEANRLQAKAVDAWQEAIQFDSTFAKAWNNLAFHFDAQGDSVASEKHRRLALDYEPDLAEGLAPRAEVNLPIWDVWTYQTDIFGDKLRSKDKKAQLIVVHLSQEFMATENVPILQLIQEITAEIQDSPEYPRGLKIGLTGSASVGADMLASSAESIKSTEVYTVSLVVIILILVYRSPLLIVVPLTTIVIALNVAEGLVAALTQLHVLPGFEWWNFRIFTTTKIFVVVILFGAGTDFCLFLISRFKEELKPDGSNNQVAVSNAVNGVGDALLGSAFTTIVGLSMMFFADFGKFRNSGPAIGLCLAVTLIACLTLAPALLRMLGKSIFWPFGVKQAESDAANENEYDSTFMGRIWSATAKLIVAYPGRILVICTLVMLPFAYMGTNVDVTYNFLSELDPIASK